jgi:hypothetical protein
MALAGAGLGMCAATAAAGASCASFTARNGIGITFSGTSAPCPAAVKIVKAFYNGPAQQTTAKYGNPRLSYQIDVRLQGFPGRLCHQSTDAGFGFKHRQRAYYREGPESGRLTRVAAGPRDCGSSPGAVQSPGLRKALCLPAIGGAIVLAGAAPSPVAARMDATPSYYAAAITHCMTVIIGGGEGATEFEAVTVVGITCDQARPVIKNFMRTYRAPRGWRLTSRNGYQTLARRRDRITGMLAG